jgi:hyaluronoglucosaminidase
MTRAFAIRGVVEGFYGTPWSHQARLDVITFLAERAMNAYLYAPKDDPKHRADWRVPYEDAELSRFRELAAASSAGNVTFGFGISPGLDIDYESPDDRELLFAKLAPLLDAGVRWFALLVDDIPLTPNLAPRQAALAAWLLARLRTVDDQVRLTVCPTEYVGTRPSPYLSDLGADLPADVDIMWTGPTVCSPEIRADDARSWAKALGDRRVIVWDNYPVNDATMTASLHLGPYRGRDPELADVVGGVLLNPMTQPRASMLPLATAADFLRAPDDYDEARAWDEAIDAVGGARAEALGVLARACADSAIAQPASLDLAIRVATLEDAVRAGGGDDHAAAIGTELRQARTLPEVFPPDAVGDDFAIEVSPWAVAAARNAEAGLAALKLLRLVHEVDVDAEQAMHAVFAVMFSWGAARADGNVVFGPRFALYTPVVQLPDGRPAIDVGLAVRENENAVDRLCRFALREYEEWRTR